MLRIGLSIYLLFVIPQLASSQDVPADFDGTYLPREYIRLLSSTGSHVVAAKKVMEQDMLPVLSLRDGRVYSDLGYHDQYALRAEVFAHNWEREATGQVTDDMGNVYDKISDNTNYHEAVRGYYAGQVLGLDFFVDDEGNTLFKSWNGMVLLNGQEYSLTLDVVFRIPGDDLDLLYSYVADQRIAFRRHSEGVDVFLYVGESEGLRVDTSSDSIEPLYEFRHDTFADNWRRIFNRTDASLIRLISSDHLRILRNTCYAMHGYAFQSGDLRDYFSSKSWYSPRRSFSEESLNRGEVWLVDQIRREEGRRAAED